MSIELPPTDLSPTSDEVTPEDIDNDTEDQGSDENIIDFGQLNKDEEVVDSQGMDDIPTDGIQEDDEDNQVEDNSEENQDENKEENELPEEWEKIENEDIKDLAKRLDDDGRTQLVKTIKGVVNEFQPIIQEQANELNEANTKVTAMEPFQDFIDEFKASNPDYKDVDNTFIAEKTRNLYNMEQEFITNPLGLIARLAIVHPNAQEIMQNLQAAFKDQAGYDAFVNTGKQSLATEQQNIKNRQTILNKNKQQRDAQAIEQIKTDSQFGPLYKAYTNPNNENENLIYNGYLQQIKSANPKAAEALVIREAIRRTNNYINSKTKVEGKDDKKKQTKKQPPKNKTNPGNSKKPGTTKNKPKTAKEELDQIDNDFANITDQILSGKKVKFN